MASKGRLEIRDVSRALQKLRDFLLGREHKLHGRFPPMVSSRTIPQPDIPRGPEIKYSNQYYYKRSPVEAIKPPVVAPIAEGPALDRDPFKKPEPGGMKPDSLCFANAPTPGFSWWWDGHCYYDRMPDTASSAPPTRGKTDCKPRE